MEQSDYSLINLESVDSTNNYAKNLIKSSSWTSDSQKFMIIAREQTAGRGRYDRQWSSNPNGNLYMSLLTSFSDISNAHRAVFAAAIGVINVINKIFGRIVVHIKWPNDVISIIDESHYLKIGGILVESHKSLSGDNYLVVGIGINIMDCSGFSNANSLRRIANNLGHDIVQLFGDMQNNAIFGTMIAQQFDYYLNMSVNNFHPLKTIYESLSCPINTYMTVKMPKCDEIKGFFKGIDSNGNLMLSLDKNADITNEIINIVDALSISIA